VKPPSAPVITPQDHHSDLSNILDHEELRGINKVGVVHIGADVHKPLGETEHNPRGDARCCGSPGSAGYRHSTRGCGCGSAGRAGNGNASG